MQITPTVDVRNLVRELAENKIRALELVREALSNAKDHNASRVYIRTSRAQRNEVSILLIDNGTGMNEKGIAAFWGIGASEKPGRACLIGYKGHGTKLYFGSQRLTVATRTEHDAGWRVMVKDSRLSTLSSPSMWCP
jgi:signal transduction histidine kinase